MPTKHGCQVSLMLMLLALSCCAGGCTKVQGEDEHLEHHIPEHKPATYAAAVKQVRDRTDRIIAGYQIGSSELLGRELTELIDIVGWLPELAGDSDMKRAAWDQVQLVSRKLMVIYQQAERDLEATPRRKWPEDNQVLMSLLGNLETQIPENESNR